MNKRKMIFCFILLGIVLTGCHSSDSEKNVNSSKEIIVIPDGYQSMNGYLERTTDIGTIDHPTIDGGIINTTESEIMRHKKLFLRIPQVHSKNKPSFIKQKSFQDDWATNRKVKQLLMTAAHHGKLDYVLKKTEEMGLPSGIAVVPMVESNYQNQVVSPKGAAGIWQLMPSVAKEYGISSTDRFKQTASTDVALKFISALYQRFKNWDLTLAAYNAGSHRIMQALQKNPVAKTIDDLDIPEETKNYVYRIKAINNTLGGMDVHSF
ncbi:hypothetical protein AYO45_01975 [Gammaproteobacteria bacterium SCGC AG-212-F23]|nr:hypothetical protein AYO45_01975 [Gammaproteobacteria bacterium SCGC AG-212-F23]